MKVINALLAKLTAALAMILLIAGCEHKELCYDHSHSALLEIRFVWDQAPDADPGSMVVNFFSPDGKLVACRELSSRNGGLVKIEAGEYMILFHNGEMESVWEATGDFDSYCLKTHEETLLAPMSRNLEAPPRPAVSSDEPVRTAAEYVWGGKHDYVPVERNKEGQFVELHPLEMTAHYTVEVVNVKNLSDNIDLSAALSGLSESMNISRGEATGLPVTVPFAISRRDDTSLEAAFVTFGHCPDESDRKHILSIYTSAKKYFNIDVTGQVHSAPDDRNVHILVDGLTLPDDKDGIKPSVNDWDEVENIEIKM